MADSIGQAYVQILPTTKGFSSKLSSELGGGGGGGGLAAAGKKMGGKLIAGLAAAGIGAAAIKGITESVKAGGELEQSLGGIEALFGSSADKVKENASKAFSTVGVSANEYMQNVTSFSASLISGLNGDTAKAASIADMAMQDMGDNANRFGTSIESIQNAYQGFAKGNFTMLDNLKLGYGGTKTEMLRLVKDAGVVDESVKSLDDVSFDQMIEGIHKVQEGLNITGTTANEAATTLQGSMQSFKAVAQDLLGNLAIGADITPQIEALLDTAQAFLTNNLLPMISNVITGVTKNAGKLASVLSALVVGLGQEIIKVAPLLLKAGLTLILELGKSLVKAVPKMLPMITQVIIDLALMLTEPKMLKDLINTGVDLILALADGLVKAIPQLIKAVPQIIMNIVTALVASLPKILKAGSELIQTLSKGFLAAWSSIQDAIADLSKKIFAKFKGIDFAKIGKDIINGIKNGLANAKENLLAKIREIADLLPDSVKKILKIGSPSKVMIELFKWVPIGAAIGIEKGAHYLDEAVDDMVNRNPLLSSRGMSMNISTRDNAAANVYGSIYDAVKRGASEAQPVVILNGRVLSRELKGMGVSFA